MLLVLPELHKARDAFDKERWDLKMFKLLAIYSMSRLWAENIFEIPVSF